MYLEQNQFLLELAKLYESTESKGSVTITIKRAYPKDLNRSRKSDEKLKVRENEAPHLFVRAVANKKKLSTSVPPNEEPQFQDLFSSIITSHMNNLKSTKKRKQPLKN